MKPWGGTALKGRLAPIFVFVLALFLYVPFLGQRDFWAPDEPRYVRVAAEMLERKDFVLPHWNGQVYTEKPPLFFWSIASSGWLLGGLDEFSARVPVAISACLLAVIVFFLTLELGEPPRVGILASVTFFSVQKIFWQARFGQIEMVLNMLMFGAFLCLLKGLRGKKKTLWALGSVLCGLATLTKGPIGLFFPGVFTLFALLILEGRAFPRIHWWLMAAAAYLIPILPWMLFVLAVAGPDYLSLVFLKQSFGRYLEPWHHHNPFYYYALVFIPGFFPATLLLVPGLFRKFRGLLKPHKKALWVSGGIALFVLIFFSLSKGKRDIYILPAYIALCPFVAVLMDQASKETGLLRGFWRAVFFFQAILAWVLALSGVVLLADGLFGWIPKNPYGSFEGIVLLLAAVLFGLSLRLKASLPVRFLIPYVAFSFFLHGFLLPPIDRYKSAKPFVLMLKNRFGDDVELASFGPPNVGLLFYYGKNIPAFRDVESLLALVEKDGPNRRLVVCYASDLKKLPRKEAFITILKGNIGSKALVVGRYGFKDGANDLVDANSRHQQVFLVGGETPHPGGLKRLLDGRNEHLSFPQRGPFQRGMR